MAIGSSTDFENSKNKDAYRANPKDRSYDYLVAIILIVGLTSGLTVAHWLIHFLFF